MDDFISSRATVGGYTEIHCNETDINYFKGQFPVYGIKLWRHVKLQLEILAGVPEPFLAEDEPNIQHGVAENKTNFRQCSRWAHD